MGILLTLAGALGALQDAEARYREALYHEVDKGDLEKAIELYRGLESDASAPEAARARAAFRRAWCLEKKGQRAEAEKAYRDVLARHASQPETAQKARERLDRLVSGEGRAASPISAEDRISELILELGSHGDGSAKALRSLVLIGEPAVPALRKALEHKDVTLSSMAAVALVSLEKDEGTYAPLLRGLPEMRFQGYVPNTLAALLKRREDHRREFAKKFKKEEDPSRIGAYVVILEQVQIPEVRDRLKELIVSETILGVGDRRVDLFPGGLLDKSVVEAIIRTLREVQEEEIVDLLTKLEKLKDGRVRARMLLNDLRVKVADVAAFAKPLLALFSRANFLDSTIVRRLQVIAPFHEVLRECAPTWFRNSQNDQEISLVEKLLWDWEPERASVVSYLLDQNVADEIDVSLLGLLDPLPEGAARGVAEKALWRVAARKEGKSSQVATGLLLRETPESHPRFEELIGWAIRKPSHILPLVAKGRPRIGHPSLFRVFGDIDKYTPEGQNLVRRRVNEMMLERDPELQLRALDLIAKIGDESRFDVLSKVADDESRDENIRVAVIDMMGRTDASPAVRLTLSKLARHEKASIRAAAASALTTWRDKESDDLLAGLVDDVDAGVRSIAVGHFAKDPQAKFLDPLLKALKSRDKEIRSKAAFALGATEAIEAVWPLIGLLEDADPSVRIEVRRALERIKKRYEEKAQWLEWYERVKPKDK